MDVIYHVCLRFFLTKPEQLMTNFLPMTNDQFATISKLLMHPWQHYLILNLLQSVQQNARL